MAPGKINALEGRLRRFSWWALSPAAYANVVLARRTGCRVLLGPFAGMRYPPTLVTGMILEGAMQVGSYEAELHDAVEGLIEADPSVVINVGAAGGYYAVGLARRLGGATVIAYETVAENRDGCRQLAEANVVADRVGLRGTCDAEEFAGLGAEAGGDTAIAVVMDCEGLELELVDPERFEWLRRASLLVELHPSIDPESGTKLAARLDASHECELIDARERFSSSFHQIWTMPGLRNVDRELLVGEHRHGLQSWLWARPR